MQDLKPWFGVPPHATPPDLPGYRLVAHEKISIGKISIIGMLLIPAWAFAFLAIIAMLGGRREYSADVTLIGIAVLAAIMFLVVLVHELVHGAVAALLGAKPSFGVGPGFAYTTFVEPMGKSRYLAVGLAPLIVLSVAAVAIALAWPSLAGWMIAAATINASGSIGDLWMTVRILRALRDAIFHDLADGFAVYVPDNR